MDASLAFGVALGIAVATGLWWVYFDGDEARADAEFEKATEQRRQMLASYAFTGAHLVMITGVVLVAAGITGERGGHRPPASTAHLMRPERRTDH